MFNRLRAGVEKKHRRKCGYQLNGRLQGCVGIRTPIFFLISVIEISRGAATRERKAGAGGSVPVRLDFLKFRSRETRS